MSDETKTETTQTEETKSGQVVFNSQADFDAVITNRLAKEKAKYSDYDETKAKLEQLTAEINERKEAEMSELEKAQNQVNELTGQIEELKPYKEKLTEYELQQEDKINKQMEDAELTDEQKQRINKLPLADRAGMVADLIGSKQITPPSTAGKYPGVGTPKLDDIYQMPRGEARNRAYGEYKKAIR